MADFTGCYLVCKEIGEGKMVVKYGDTRGEANLESRYDESYYLKKTRVHGRSGKRRIGKYLQGEVLDRLVKIGEAEKIGKTEGYIVRKETGMRLIRNWEENTQKGYVSKADIEEIAKQRL